MMNRKPPVSPDAALASDVFDQLCAATTLKAILQHHRHLCDILKIKPTNFPHFYPKLKAKLGSWKAQALWNKFDKRASHKCYNRGKACSQSKVLIIGAGPCGLRAAIEAQLLGARVVVVEKRDRITRNNVLHLWPFVIQDLRGLGAKKFFGKFCAGAIDHISIRQLQCILLKVALILGVEIHEGVTFESLNPPPADQDGEKVGWRASVSPPDHPVSQYEFDVLIGADGKRNTLEGFKRKEFRGKLAIAITANFINRRTEAEARVQEISGVAFIFNQKFFKDLYSETGIDLENIVYYKDDTHYFVMTAKKHSLIDKGVILQDFADTAKLLDPANVDKGALLKYAKEAADFSTNYMLPDLDFAVNHYGQPDVAMFDFTSMYAAENASRAVEKNGHKLLQLLVGDSLLEPFWPTGSGCARGFLSSMDACWAIKSWAVNGALSPLEVLAERESIYRLLGQTTPENLQKDPLTYTLDPHTRYPNLNTRSVLAHQVRNLFETDDPTSMELALTPINNQEVPKKRRRKDSQVHPDTLLQWLKRQVCLHPDLHVENMTYSFKSGLVLCAIISRYRPDLLDYSSLQTDDIAANNQRAFDILEKELGIPPVMSGEEMADCECPDRLTMLSYLSQVYDTFRGEIPHIKHPDYAQDAEEPEDDFAMISQSKTRGVRTSSGRKRHSGENNRADLSLRRSRKRRSGTEKFPFGDEERQKILEEIEQNRRERQLRRQYLRQMQTEQFKKSVAMMECNQWTPENADGFQDYSLYVYRQTAPEFTDRVKSLEMKLLYPDKESRLRAELKSRLANEPDEEFSGRIKDFEEKLLKGSGIMQKKPRDLLRAIGKIEKTDWNVKEIEKKIEENKLGKSSGHDRPEKVPKWSRQQFDDKFQAMEKKLLSKGLDQVTASRYAEVDLTLKKLEQKLKEGSSLDTGQRGSNKVSAMAEQFAPKSEDKNPIQKSASKGAVVLPNQGSEKCHFCNKRVYVMERVNAEGKFFHRSCFKCEYCGSTLRVGNYMFDKEGKYNNRFYCNQHFGLPGTIKQRLTKNQERNLKMALSKPKAKPSETPPSAKIVNKHLQTPPATEAVDRGATPERIEFENLAEAASDVDDGPSEMDEDEWTDRNFGASAAEGSSDDLLDETDSEEDDQDEIMEEALMTADETRKAAERWTRRHSSKTSSHRDSDGDGADSCEADDSEDFDEYSQDDDSDTAIEGEEDIKALELRKQEVRLQPQRHRQDTDTGSDTEVRLMNFKNDTDSDNNYYRQNGYSNSKTDSESDNNFVYCKNYERFGNLERSTTFSKGLTGKPVPAPVVRSRTASGIEHTTDFKSSAPFEEKLQMFGSAGCRRRSSTLENLLRNDMKEIRKCQDNEIDDEKYIDKNLVMRRESLRKTNVLNPSTLEFQPRGNAGNEDRHRFNFIVFRDQNYGGVSPVESLPREEENDSEDDSSESYTDDEEESDIDEFFEKLNLEDEENLVEKFEEMTGAYKVEKEATPEEESDLDEFFERDDVKEALEGDKLLPDEIEEILKFLEEEEKDEKAAVEPSKTEKIPEKYCWTHSESPGLLPDLDESFDKLAREIEGPDDGLDTDYDNITSDNAEDSKPEPPPVRPKRTKKKLVSKDEDVGARLVKVVSSNLPEPSKTKVATDDRSSSDESSEEIENSATEISTDSEFEHDGSAPTHHEIPDILITDHNALRRNKPNEEVMKVQVKSGNLGKTNRNESKGFKLEFSPIVESKSSSVITKNTLNSALSRPSPLLNPRRGDYLLSKTPSTEGIATKMSLELRKKYLLGNSGSTNAVTKSGSATALDSRIKTFESNITQCQKLLNPASEISPTMQAFLQTTSKKVQPPSPTIITPALNLPPSSMIFRKQKELPQGDKDFVHICGKPEQGEEKKLNVLNENVRQKTVERKIEDKENKHENGEDNKENEENKENYDEEKGLDNEDCRPRSPAHETSILVPQIPWTNKNSSENLSDSLSESESESVSSSSENELAEVEKLKHMPPRLEIRNSRGELMDEEGFEPDSLQIFDDEYHSPMSMEKQLELAKSKINELKNSIARSESDIQNANSVKEKVEPPKEPYSDRIQRKNSLILALSKEKLTDDDLKFSCPPSPASNDESCRTMAVLTETELSDWARDGDNCVSEDFEDIENLINKEDRKRSKEGRKPKSLDLNLDEPFAHICGKDKPPKLLASNENLDFMDTDVSERDLISMNSNDVFENKGYFRFVNEDEATTPVVEVESVPSPEKTVQDNSSSSTSTKSSSSSSNEPKPSPPMTASEIKEDVTTEESTTSEQTTIKNLPVNKNFDISDETFYSPLIDMSPISPKSVPELDGKCENEFEEYIQNLQGRISPFHNVRDSIDYRKSKQKTGKLDRVEGVNAITEDEEKPEEPIEKKEVEENHVSPDSNPTSKKLQEIWRERSIQKDLVHEMVLKKVLPGKKSPSDRKLRKITRSGPRILNGSLKPLETPPSPEDKGNAEVPFVDSSLENDVFHSNSKTNKYTSNLPDTPLTNPDAFPNFNSYDFKTPVAPPREKKQEKPKEPSTAERDKIREEARARARLKSDEELGLSPEEKMISIRENANRLLETPIRKIEKSGLRSQFDFNLKNFLDGERRVIGSWKSESPIPKSSSTSKVFEKLRGVDKSPLGLKSGQKSTSDLVTSVTKDEEPPIKSLSSSGPSTSSSSTNKTESEKKRSRDRERRRSIIQAVSDFFHKKSPSPSKSPSPTKPDKFSSKFRLTAKSKDKKEFAGLSNAEQPPSGQSSPPPVPPPPNLFKPTSYVSVEESAGSETDEILSNMSTPSHGTTASVDSATKRARMTKRMAAQAERKRLRMAQEIQRRLEEVEEKQKELESRGVVLEKALRGEIKEEEKDDTELLREWFELLRERNELRRYEKELMVRAQEVELEDRHARLQHELKNLLAKDDSCRTKEEVLQEGAILREMLDTVEKRGALATVLEQEQERYHAEEKDLEAQVLAKGIRLTPIRKYEYQSAV